MIVGSAGHQSTFVMRFLLLLPLLAALGCVQPPANESRATTYDPETAAGPNLEALEEGDLEAARREQEMLQALAAKGIYPEKRPTQVTVRYHRSGQTIGLYNESYVSQSDYYSQQRRSAAYKVVEDINMGALLKQLEDFGFFRKSTEGVVKRGGASVSVLVRFPDEAWTFSWGPADGADDQDFAYKCADAVRAIYNTTTSLQLIENTEGAAFFDKEADRLKNEGRRGGTQ